MRQCTDAGGQFATSMGENVLGKKGRGHGEIHPEELVTSWTMPSFGFVDQL